MATEIPHRIRFVINAALLLACVAIGGGCSNEPSPEVDSSQAAQSQTADAGQIPPEPPTSSISNSPVDKSSGVSPKLETSAGTGDQSSAPKTASVSATRADQKNEKGGKTESAKKTALAGKAKAEGKKKRKYTEAQLNKNQTTLLLASQADLRAVQLLLFVRDELTDEQAEQATKLILKESHHYERLKAKRREILNAATDGDQTEEKMLELKYEILDLSQRLRTKVIREILTREQKEFRRKAAEASRLEKAEAEAKKTKT